MTEGDLLAFTETDAETLKLLADKAASQGVKAAKIVKLASGETIKSPNANQALPPEYVKAIRFHAVNITFDLWNEQVKASGEGSDIYIGDVVKPLQERVRLLISLKAWKWGIPSELTVRRRIEEAALPRYYPETGRPAIVSVEPSFYRPNPYFLDPKTRQAIREQIKAAEILA